MVIPAAIPLGGGSGTLVTLGVGLTAYALGVRHAFDADHIAAIDNTTRRLLERGKPANTVGFWFSLGHSTIVVVLCILLTLGITAIGTSLADDSSALRTWTGIIGPSVSGAFLLIIAAINIASLRRRQGTRGRGGAPSCSALSRTRWIARPGCTSSDCCSVSASTPRPRSGCSPWRVPPRSRPCPGGRRSPCPFCSLPE